jgi:magnesium-protoporphyrin IX monomethyl ester (oxidative) cyclase
VNKYGIKEISFIDDNFGANKKRLSAICNEILRRGLEIKWSTPNGIPHWTLDEELLDAMKRSGCYRLTFGIESGNISTREFIGKNYPLDQAKRIIKYANKIGLWTICTFIIGFPYEGKESILDTIYFAIDCDTDYAVFFLLGPFPGTKVYEILKRESLIDFDKIFEQNELTTNDLALLGQALASRGTKTKYFDQKELQDWLAYANKAFIRSRFLNIGFPLRIINKIHSIEDCVYVGKITGGMFKTIIMSLIGHYKTHFSLRS